MRRNTGHVRMNIFCAHLRVSYSFLTKLTKVGLVVAPFAHTKNTTKTTWSAQQQQRQTTGNCKWRRRQRRRRPFVNIFSLFLFGTLVALCTAEQVQLKCKCTLFFTLIVICIIIILSQECNAIRCFWVHAAHTLKPNVHLLLVPLLLATYSQFPSKVENACEWEWFYILTKELPPITSESNKWKESGSKWLDSFFNLTRFASGLVLALSGQRRWPRLHSTVYDGQFE